MVAIIVTLVYFKFYFYKSELAIQFMSMDNIVPILYYTIIFV